MRKRAAAPASSGDVQVKEGGKGRPTPSRKAAEAATRARAKGPTDKKGAAKLARQRRNEQTVKTREGMKRGDERYLTKRDRGPVRRFVRDWVDARICMAELLLPLLLLIMITGSFSAQFSTSLWSVTILLVAIDTALLVFRLRRQLTRRFPDVSTKGAVGYAVLRSVQVRFLRLPKTQVKLGTKLPDNYPQR